MISWVWPAGIYRFARQHYYEEEWRAEDSPGRFVLVQQEWWGICEEKTLW